MKRCIELAMQGAAYVAPNPMVGAVLVYENRIIGEGYHQIFGGPHAEVNCIASVLGADKALISSSTMYVSLEPCAHHGKTPPCSDLLISNRVARVVVGCRDPFHAVNGKGIEKMHAAGIEVVTGVLEKECMALNKRFFTFHKHHRPYIILKWAQTADGKIGNIGNNRLMITNELTNRLVHKWRSEEMGIMIGTNTAALDNPRLTNRLWFGKNPVRIVVDSQLGLSSSLNIFAKDEEVVVFNLHKHGETNNTKYYQVSEDASLIHQALNGLYAMNIQSIMVEGGARLLQSFIDDDSWDEARVITNERLTAKEGVPAPVLANEALQYEDRMGTDMIRYYKRTEQ